MWRTAITGLIMSMLAMSQQASAECVSDLVPCGKVQDAQECGGGCKWLTDGYCTRVPSSVNCVQLYEKDCRVAKECEWGMMGCDYKKLNCQWDKARCPAVTGCL